MENSEVVRKTHMKGNDIKGRIFLVGCPRSGTTLLQSFLAGHSSITSFPESHFFRKGFKGFRKYVPGGYYAATALIEWLNTLEPSVSNKARVSRLWSKRQSINHFINQLDMQTLQAGKSVWLEKTPGHVMYMDVISKYIDDARFIHIIRDGRAVVASLYEVTKQYPDIWGGARSLVTCINQWNKSIAMSAHYIDDPRHVFISYESILYEPELQVKRLCSFLGLEYEPQMILNFQKTSRKVITPGEDWKEGVSQPLYDRGLSKFNKIFDEAQREKVTDNLDWSSLEHVKRLCFGI